MDSNNLTLSPPWGEDRGGVPPPDPQINTTGRRIKKASPVDVQGSLPNAEGLCSTQNPL